jgi:hypothetical protein
MPMFISASAAILWSRIKISDERHSELMRDGNKVRAQYAIDTRDRAIIPNISDRDKARIRARVVSDKLKISKLLSTLSLSHNHTQCTAAWVCNTLIDGPPELYMRVVPLPVRTYI